MTDLTPEQQDALQLAQIKQRPSPYRAKHIGVSIRQLMARTGLGQTQAAEELARTWSEIVGPQLSASTHPAKISRGVLNILVQDSSSLQEFELQKRRLLAELQKKLPHAGIKNIRGRVG